MESPFYEATVCQLSFGEDVDSLPDFLFSEAYFQMPELTVSIPRIGAACFQGVWDTKSDNCSPVELTITEDVEYIGLSAFAYNRISRLDYGTNAVNGATSTTNGVFQSSEIGELVIEEQVEVIRPFLFANVKFVEDIDLELDIPVGDYAFFSSQKSFHGFGNVKLGENVSYVGKGAFHYRDMDTLFYHAVSAAVELKSTNDAPFFGCVLGELQFGDKVEVLGKSLFCGVELKQEEIVFPDSVREIGNYFFYNYPYLNDGIQVGTLRIGSGLKMLTDHTFHGIGFDSVYVEAWEAGEDYSALADGAAAGYLPVCGDLYIHRGSDFYHYFAANAVEKHLYCEDFMVSSVGEERFDEDTHKFVTPLYETCSVCGYRLESEKVEDACAVTFLAMGDVVDVRYCKAGGDVESPDAPAASGYVFQGWDHSCEGIWADMEVNAVYAEREYQVTVYAVYADGRESGHTVYGAKKGEVITLPVYEPGLEKVVLEGYEGVRVYAPDFVWSIGGHDGTYRVSGDAEIVAREGNFYVVQFVDEAGKGVDTQKVHSGYDAVPPVIEDATVSGSDGVITKSWEKGYYNVDSDRVVRMESSKEYFSYAVSFVDENGNVIKTVTVVHGAAVEDIPEAPEKVSDGCFAYLFREWVCEGASTVDCVVGDAVFRPAYSASAMIYRVYFESNGGGDVESVEVEGGKCLAEPDTPVREGYGFAGWYVDRELEPEPEPVPEMRPDEESVPESDGVPESKSLPEFVPDQSTISRQGTEGSPVELSRERHGMDRLLPVAVAVAVGTGGSGGFVFFWFFRRRRVAGIVMDVDGNGMEGICVLLDDRKIVTNQRGEFRFHGMRRGNHKFCVFDGRDKAVLVMELFTDAVEDRGIFTVLEDDTVRTDAHREGKRYFVDVVMAKGI